MRPSPPLSPRAAVPILFLVSASGLIFEVALTRLFSLFFQYHFAFLAVSVAVFGLSIGAALARALRPQPGKLPAHLVRLLTGLGAAYTLAAALIALLPSASSIWPRALLAVLPFVLTGLFIAWLFEAFSQASGTLYAADLIGAAVGVAAVVLLLNGLSAFNLVYLLGAGLVGAALWFKRRILPGATLRPQALALLFALALFAANLAAGWFDYNPRRIRLRDAPRDKTMLFILNDPAQGAQIVRTAHSPFARVDVVQTNDPSAMFVFTDGGAGSFMLRFDGETADASLLASIEGLPFQVRRPQSALIVGAGGGKDILLALASGATDITAVEVNPAVVDVTQALSEFNGSIYNRPEVALIQGDGRNFAERSKDRYDLIYLNLVYTQAAEPASQALVENYIFTVEAFETYYQRLAPGGHLAVISHNALEASRAALTALKALQNLGIGPRQGLDHLALWMYPSEDPTLRTSIMLLGKDPLSPETLQALTAGAQAQGMTPLFIPGEYEFPFEPLRRHNNVDAFIDADASYDLSPTADDSPYFFKLDHGIPPAIRQALGASVFLAGLLLAGALLWRPQGNGSALPWVAMAAYAALIGMGFLMVEIPLIQRLQLLLGYPTLTFSVTLGGLLLAGGAGSLISQRWATKSLPARVAAAALGIAALAVVYRYALPPLVGALLLLGIAARALAAFVLAALPGLLMGIPFPSLIRLAGERRERVAWLFALNGAFSVLGSTTAVVISMTGGFSMAMLAGAAAYLLLAGFALVLGRVS